MLALSGGIASIVIVPIVWYLLVLYHPSGVQPPLKALDIAFDTISFRAENGVLIAYKTGSMVRIPPNALVDGDGNAVSGVVSAHYREFHNPYDIFRAGIPMGDITTGQALMSGGMFELTVWQQNEPLALASGKTVGVSLAAYRPTDGYNVYEFGGELNWQENGLPQLDTNLAKLEALAALQPLPPKPIDPQTNANDIVIDLDANYYSNPDLAFFKNTRWRLVPEENPGFQQNLWAFSVTWDKMKIVKHDPERNLYKLEMKQRQETYAGKGVAREHTVMVTPVLEGADLEASMAQFKLAMQQYDSVAVYIIQEKERLEAQADLLDTFNIESLGLHNIDKLIEEGTMLAIKADFDFQDAVNPYFTKIRVYFLNNDLNTVQNYGMLEWGKVYVQPNSNTTLLAILPNGEVAILDGTDFARLPLQDAITSQEPYRFKMKIVPQETLKPLMGLTAAR